MDPCTCLGLLCTKAEGFETDRLVVLVSGAVLCSAEQLSFWKNLQGGD